MSRKKVISWIGVIVAWTIFVVSLTQPALLFEREGPVSGWNVLLIGWLGVLGIEFAWYANPLFLATTILIVTGYYRYAAISGAASVLVASLSFLAREWWFNEARGTPIIGLGPAFWIWYASIIFLEVFALCLWRFFTVRPPPFKK